MSKGTRAQDKKEEEITMTTICIYPDPTVMNELIHETLDEIANRIPCIANYRHGEITVKCRVEDAAWVENMLADLV